MIAYYPQLQTGSMTQFPSKRTHKVRAIANELEDGSLVVLADEAAATVEWQLDYEGISDGEADSLRSFFESMEGALGTFCFADPGVNLLAWSETLGNAAWVSATPLVILGQVVDPFGGMSATTLTNTSAAPLTIQQNVAIPGSMTAAFGLYARGAAAHTTVQLRRQDGVASAIRTLAVDTTWRQLCLSSSLPGGSGSSVFSLAIDPGEQVTVYGLSVVAQPVLSLYLKTQSQTGLYASTRFASDQLNIARTANNQNKCQVKLISVA